MSLIIWYYPKSYLVILMGIGVVIGTRGGIGVVVATRMGILEL